MKKKNRLDYIVTGTGRCGTLYLARLLTSLEIPCGHESIFNTLGIDQAKLNMEKPVKVSPRSTEYWNWLNEGFIQAEASYMAAPFLNEPILAQSKIIHLVRNPIKVIFSFCDEFKYFINLLRQYEKYIHGHLLARGDDMEKVTTNQILRAAFYYIKWNEMIEQACQGRDFLLHRIEDDIKPVLDYVGRSKATDYFTDKRANTNRHNIFSKTIHDIPNHPIKEELIRKAEQYKYDLFSTPPSPRLLFL